MNGTHLWGIDNIVYFVNFSIQKDNPPLPWQLSVHVRKAMLPFLRCGALLFHYLTGVAAPAELTGTHCLQPFYLFGFCDSLAFVLNIGQLRWKMTGCLLHVAFLSWTLFSKFWSLDIVATDWEKNWGTKMCLI